jgi:hypothetical protein
VHAAELTNREKGLTILSNTVGLNLTNYVVTTKEHSLNESASNPGIVSQENVEYSLRSEVSKINVLATFANGNLQMMHVLDNVGSPITTIKASSNTVTAKNFLESYHNYTANSLFGELSSTLDNVDNNKNLTKDIGNTELQISAINGYTTFKWTYVFNGIIAPSKFVALGFNNSCLTAFVDNWQLYKIGSTTVNLSEKEVEIIGLNAAKTHSWSLPLENDAFDPNNFNVSNVIWKTLIFDNSLGANKTRGADSLNSLSCLASWS